MCSELKALDSQTIKESISYNFLSETSEDNFISITCDGGVLIYRLCLLKDNLLSSVSFVKYFIKTNEYMLSQNLEINLDSVVSDLKRFDLYECVLRSDTSACLKNCSKKKFYSVAVKWSPQGVIGRQCVVAILNDGGGINLYTKIVDCNGFTNFEFLCNAITFEIQHYKHEWNQNEINNEEMYEEFKKRLFIHTPLAFIWTHLIELEEMFTLFCIAHTNGKITFWKCKRVDIENYADFTLEFYQDLETNLEEISVLHWIQSNNDGLLLIGNKSALTIYPIQEISKSGAKIEDCIRCDFDDEIRIDKIISGIIEDKLFIFLSKQEYLLIFMFDKNGKMLDSCTFNTSTLSITELQIVGNKLLVLTYGGIFKELVITIKDEQIQIAWRHIYINLNWTLQHALGFFISQNNLIYTFITNYCHFYTAKGERDTFHLYNFLNKAVDPFKLIFNNKLNTINHLYDCFESIRIGGILLKELQMDSIPKNINYDALNLTELKCYLFLSNIYEYLCDQNEMVILNPFKHCADIQKLIQIKLSIYYIQKIDKEFHAKGKLNPFKKKCLRQLITFLRECIMQDFIIKCELENNLVEELFDILSKMKDVDLAEKEKCLICENEIIGSFCINNHFDHRCSITMLQILSQKYVCPFCKQGVSDEAIADFDVKVCPICDVLLDYQTGNNFNSIQKYDECKSDCENEIVENI